MGYHTEYIGEFKFTRELKASELAHLKKFLGEDSRDHEDWPTLDNGYVSLELTDEFDGLKCVFWIYAETGKAVVIVYPEWLGREDLHMSHRSNLIRKDAAYYGITFAGTPLNLPYVWPVRATKYNVQFNFN